MWIQLSRWGHAGGGAWREETQTHRGEAPPNPCDGAGIRDASTSRGPTGRQKPGEGPGAEAPARPQKEPALLTPGPWAPGPQSGSGSAAAERAAQCVALGHGRPQQRRQRELTRVWPADCAWPSGPWAPGVLSLTHLRRPLLPGARPVSSLLSPATHACDPCGAGGGGGPCRQCGEVTTTAWPCWMGPKSPPQPGPAGWDPGYAGARRAAPLQGEDRAGARRAGSRGMGGRGADAGAGLRAGAELPNGARKGPARHPAAGDCDLASPGALRRTWALLCSGLCPRPAALATPTSPRPRHRPASFAAWEQGTVPSVASWFSARAVE